MFCPACGAQSDDGAKFCKKCGTVLGDAPAGYVAPKLKKKFRWGRVFVGLTVAFAAAVGGWVVMNVINGRALAAQQRALVLPLDSAVAIFKSSDLIPRVDSNDVRASYSGGNNDLSDPIFETSGPSPLRATQCIKMLKTTDSIFGFANTCKYPVEIIFCANEAPRSSPAAVFQCEDGAGRIAIGSEGQVAVGDFSGAPEIWVGACNATESGPNRLWTSVEQATFGCSKRKRESKLELLGTGVSKVGTTANTLERLSECRAIAGDRKLQGAVRTAFLDACVNEPSLEGNDFNETENPKQ